MRIYSEFYDAIVEYAQNHADREVGGVLACDRSGDICLITFEKPNSEKWYQYAPDVDFLNKTIEEWPAYFQFAGLFHSHLNNQSCLSATDRAYITKILSAMPREISILHFPLCVLPEGRLYGFKAERAEDGSIGITEEPVDVI